MLFLTTDLDGTFLHDDHDFDRPRFEKLLAEWRAQGNRFVVATGREYKWVASVFADYLNDIDIISSNGTVITLAGQEADMASIKPESLDALQKIIADMPVKPSGSVRAYTENKVHLLKTDVYGQMEEKDVAFMAPLYDGIVDIDNLLDIDKPVSTVTGVWADRDSSEAVSDVVNNANIGIHATTSGYGAVDFLPSGVNKAAAIKKLLSHYGTTEQAVYAFGDGMNDLEMLQLAGHAYVMANGDDKLRVYGFEELPNTHMEDGVLVKWETLV
ncbi:HAD-IIB family hydrolase [Weissella ceti]|uniref:HAD-IIB family hydrolase n=1 Tax=Weissella ceti TaxID=759620 RepID=A0ABT3E5D3_9LACO|nr:HAD-IIB family hydrolase [Weissella ceti]MCW0953575.1 HAD-IIB family hydrolase [Weissella ceti]QVK12204.1 HAD-IIB family hydrolase [Weissella ceti]